MIDESQSQSQVEGEAGTSRSRSRMGHEDSGHDGRRLLLVGAWSSGAPADE